MAAPVIIILGPPGSGKGTQSAILAREYKAVHLSSGEVFRSSGDEVLLARMAEGKLVTVDDFRKAISRAIKRVPGNQMIILDGMGRIRSEVEWLHKRLIGLQRPIKKVIHLRVSQEIFLERNLSRHRHDDQPEAQAKRWSMYQQHMLLTMEYYRQLGLLAEVDGSGAVDEVAEQIKEALDEA